MMPGPKPRSKGQNQCEIEIENEHPQESTERNFSFKLPHGFEETHVKNKKDDSESVYPTILNDLEDDDTEIWLIQTPSKLIVKDLDGLHMSLDARTKFKSEETGNMYELVAEKELSSELKSTVLFLPSVKSGKLKPVAKTVSGHLSVLNVMDLPEIFCSPEVKQKPSIPPDLKVRYVPFGADEPVQYFTKSPKKERKRAKHKELTSSTKVKNELRVSDTTLQIEKEIASPKSENETKRSSKKHSHSQLREDDILYSEIKHKVLKNALSEIKTESGIIPDSFSVKSSSSHKRKKKKK